MLFKIVHTWSCIQIRRWKTRRFHFQWVHDLVTELLQYSSLACLMPIWQLCANLLIPNCLRSNLSYSPLAVLELYVNISQTKNNLHKFFYWLHLVYNTDYHQPMRWLRAMLLQLEQWRLMMPCASAAPRCACHRCHGVGEPTPC